MTEQPEFQNVCCYPECGHRGNYQRVIIDSKNGAMIRRQNQLFCQHHWWTIEEKK